MSFTEAIFRTFYKDEANFKELLPDSQIEKIFNDFYSKLKQADLESEIDPLKSFEEVKKQNKKQIVSVQNRPDIDSLYYNSKKVEETTGFTKEEIDAMPSESLREEARNLTEQQKTDLVQAENVINCLIS